MVRVRVWLVQAAKSAISAAVEVESEQRMGQSARITELETLLEAAQREVTPHHLTFSSPGVLP